MRKSIFNRLTTRLLLLLAMMSTPFVGAIASVTIAQSPLFLTQGSTPLVMLDMSRDHQLYFKAYDDYSDIDGDGVADTTYKNSVDYYGYFDSYKCYIYSPTNNRFEPSRVTANKYCNAAVALPAVTPTTEWSGNFLNWATMTRMDEVRKILYGGLRSTDSATETVLERVFLPNDAHSFAKFYSGLDKDGNSDIAKLVPTGFAIATGVGSTNGITICNTTVDSTNLLLSQNTTAAPLMRVAKGNYALWSANERWQCRWSGEKSASNGNDATKSGLSANSSNPSSSTNGLKAGTTAPDYNVRVKVCVTGLIGQESCKTYPSGNAKPIGLLQTYGDNDAIKFGLLTGSYAKNKSGGVLRKNIGSMSSEINVTTNGTFITSPSGGGIIQTINALKIYGYRYEDGTYFGVTGSDNCSWALNTFANGNCSNWGNPQSEMYLEAVRYLAGKSATATFSTSDATRFANLITATWSSPQSSANYCAPLSVMQINASTSSYDSDELASAYGASGFGMSSATDLNSATNSVGLGELINGNSFFIGENATNHDQLCTPKTLVQLSDALGTCPEAPRLGGSYQIAGLAYYARTHDLRSDLSSTQTVKTYGIALSPAVPKIKIPVPGSLTGQTITILPACRNSTVSGNCAIVDFKVVSQTTGSTNSGKFMVIWEDSEQGGDFDQDMWGTISYQITSSSVKITTQVVAQSSGDHMGFGYVLGGTAGDGFHVHSGVNGFAYTGTESTGNTKCSNCNNGDAATTNTYAVGSSTVKTLEQPLFYAAKWGGFDESASTSNQNNKPDLASEWDTNGDGIPDNYFYATNPSQLAASLSAALLKIAADVGSASAVATNSTRFDGNNVIYQAKFDSKNWSGQLLAYPLQSDGSFTAGTQAWDASAPGKIPATSRNVYTWNGSSGVALTWANLTIAQQNALVDTAGGESTYINAQKRLLWLAGDQTNEDGVLLRKRTTLLGDIVNSDPVYAGAEDRGYTSLPTSVPGQSAYAAYVTSKKTRTAIIAVGANDGMLHIFKASDGTELFAFMPMTSIMKAIVLTQPSYGSTINPHQYFVNGSMYVDDVYIGGAWRTYLFGAMGSGGRAVFALDISNPDSMNASSIKFEMTSTDDSHLGYVLGQPQIALLADGTWSAVFGNGYNSGDDRAYLMIVDLSNKSNATAIATSAGTSNGLAGPELLMRADGTTSTAYAGDLLGNLWKFDLSSTTRSSWAIAYGQPLFMARSSSGAVQPITSTPNLGFNFQDGNKVMVYFGTGQYFATGDNVVVLGATVQSFYAIKDVGPITTTDRSELWQKTWGTAVVNGATVPAVNETQVNWPNYKGWYLDLSRSLGERVITSALLAHDQLIFPTFIPSQNSCSFGGSGELIDTAGVNGTAFVPIIGQSTVQLAVAVIKTPAYIESGSKIYFPSSNLQGNTGGLPTGTPPPVAGQKGRVSWRQLK